MSERPLCKCHGEPMTWSSHWRCAIKLREAVRRRYCQWCEAHPGYARRYSRQWREAHREWSSLSSYKRKLRARIKFKQAKLAELNELLGVVSAS